ncbi:hypothetical protein OQA88_13704 [Cercophora sp. LCS_1]
MASIASRPLPAVSPSAASTSVSASSAVPSASTMLTPTVRFTNAQHLFSAIDSTTGDFLTVTNVSPDQFTEIERARGKQRRKFRFRRYHGDSQILIITIPTAVHEALRLGLYRLYWNQLFRNGTENPRPERVGAGDWPTLVIGSGHSETVPELHKDMRWWFRASNHEVKIVILAKFDHQQHRILLEKWEEETSSPQGAITEEISSPQGAITEEISSPQGAMQQNGVLNPVKRQSITITRDETTDPGAIRHAQGDFGPICLGMLYIKHDGGLNVPLTALNILNNLSLHVAARFTLRHRGAAYRPDCLLGLHCGVARSLVDVAADDVEDQKIQGEVVSLAQFPNCEQAEQRYQQYLHAKDRGVKVVICIRLYYARGVDRAKKTAEKLEDGREAGPRP